MRRRIGCRRRASAVTCRIACRLRTRRCGTRADIAAPAADRTRVDADDGAQVFVGGRRLRQHRQWFFVPPELTGRHRVVVRVLNNAMQGGLRRVSARRRSTVSRRPLEPANPAARRDSSRIRCVPSKDAAARPTMCLHRVGGQSERVGRPSAVIDADGAPGRRRFQWASAIWSRTDPIPAKWPALVETLAPLSERAAGRRHRGQSRLRRLLQRSAGPRSTSVVRPERIDLVRVVVRTGAVGRARS